MRYADEMIVGIRSQHRYIIVTGSSFKGPGVCIGMPYFYLHMKPDGIVRSQVVNQLC